MKTKLFVSLASVLFCGLSFLGFAQENAKYLNPNEPIERRIDDLLVRMTTEEKISQISDSWGSRGIVRLKVPSLLKTEGLHSQSYSTGSTIFPEPISMAATFDPELIGRVGKQTALESKAAHIRSSWSPVLDVARDMRWGRVEETYGESPYLVSRMGVAWIDGFQQEGMIAVPKHFAGHGQPMGGRDSQDIGLSDRVMREIHLPGFRAAIEEAHTGGIMAAYGLWDGVPDNASTVLLQQILRQEWDFDGFVVSDCGGPENFIRKQAIVEKTEEAAALAAKAGVNMECGTVYRTAMSKAVANGLVSAAQLDEVVRPVLRAKFKLGLFEHSEPDKMVWEKLPQYDTPESRALARKVEIEGSVLLKNGNRVLPLSKNIKTIAVIGPDADQPQTGDYSPKISQNQWITLLQGIKSHVGPDAKVVYAPGLDTPLATSTDKFPEAIAAAKKADVAVVVVGDSSHPEGGEGTTGENRDGATLELPGAQRDLIKAIYATGTPVVLVIINGKPFTLGWEADHIPAILVAWYPGQEGGDAIADLLFGDHNPSGRLPVTWPRSAVQLPLNYDYHPSGRRYDYYDMSFTPQYRFGFGLSYSRFRYSDLRVALRSEGPVAATVSADVENVGTMDGDEIAQLYVTDLVASVSTPVIELEGIHRLSLHSGEKKTVTFELTPYQLSLLDENMVRRVEPGKFRIHIGGASPTVDAKLTEDRKEKIGFTDPLEGVSGDLIEPKDYSAHFTYSIYVPTKVANGEKFPATVTVRNEGNLTDVTRVKVYSDSELGAWSFELNPGETKSHTFSVALYKSGQLALVAGPQMISRQIAVSLAPARLVLRNLHSQVNENADLRVTAEAQNVGSESYAGEIVLKIDGRPVGGPLTMKLQAGEKQSVALEYPFAIGGLHRVQLNDLPEEQIDVYGGVGLALTAPVVSLKLDEGKGSGAKNELTDSELPIVDDSQWVSDKDGNGLRVTSPGAGVHAGNIDIYRKAFTLSARVKIDKFGDGDELAIFGGRAPMGADQDNTGTVLSAGVRHKKMFVSFQGRDISGTRDVPTGRWISLAYTYDPELRKGALYLDGNLDRIATLEPYTGPLETIGDAPSLRHGNYVLSNVSVTQSSLPQKLVKLLAQQGFQALLHGEYVSNWRSFPASVQSLETVADIPSGASLSLTIESGDKDGKILGSQTISAKAGHQSYPLRVLKGAEQIRINVRIAASASGESPVLRAVSVNGSSERQRWSTPHDWAAGDADPALIVNQGQP